MNLPTERTLYEKRGRRYVPVAEDVRWDSFPAGVHVLHIKPGGSSCHFNVRPDFGGLDAALVVYADDLRHAVRKALELRPREKRLTPKRAAAWRVFARIMGDELHCLQMQSVWDAVDEALAAFRKRMEKEVADGH